MNFTRKIFTFPHWIKYTGKFIPCLPRLALIKFTHRVSSSLQERILLSTTSINKCVLCARFASEMAFKEGVNQEEVLAILNMDLKGNDTCKKNEMTALLFAQNYAETNGNPSEKITEKLFDFYGDKIAKDIITITKKSHYFNLIGNTCSAFLSRFKGYKIQNSSLLFELLFFIIHAPVIIPSWIYVKQKKNNFSFID